MFFFGFLKKKRTVKWVKFSQEKKKDDDGGKEREKKNYIDMQKIRI